MKLLIKLLTEVWVSAGFTSLFLEVDPCYTGPEILQFGALFKEKKMKL